VGVEGDARVLGVHRRCPEPDAATAARSDQREPGPGAEAVHAGYGVHSHRTEVPGSLDAWTASPEMR